MTCNLTTGTGASRDSLMDAIVYEERVGLSRPVRLGTRRRKPRQAVSAVPKAGASRSGEARAPSLDTGIYLATSVREWRDSQMTEADFHQEQVALQKTLLTSVHQIWQDWAAKANDPESREWMRRYSEAYAEFVTQSQNASGPEEQKAIWTARKTWLKANPPSGSNAEALKWEKLWMRLNNCQTEWIGYRAACCKGNTAAIAVPVGCNHRLCPLCCYRRSQRARKRIRTMFDRLTHPVLITLTIPNLDVIRKHDFTLFRQRVRKFVSQHKDWIKGGVYSLETTYNRKEKTWHIHAHILVDAASALPTKEQKVKLAGQKLCAFTAIKLRMEFDWMRLWSGAWGKRARKGANQMSSEGDTYTFESWVRAGRAMRVKEYRNGAWRSIEGLSAGETAKRTKWNAENRRVLDVRPVTDRDGAAREVLKYITKVAAFSDLPEAVEPFCNAVRGARLIQTFGSWFGVELDEPEDAEHPENWGELTCTCGENKWKRMGVFYRDDVHMDADGRWRLKEPLDHRCRGTIPRPMIRALDVWQE